MVKKLQWNLIVSHMSWANSGLAVIQLPPDRPYWTIREKISLKPCRNFIFGCNTYSPCSSKACLRSRTMFPDGQQSRLEKRFSRAPPPPPWLHRTLKAKLRMRLGERAERI